MELRNGKIAWAVRDRRIRNAGYRDVPEAASSCGCIGGEFDPTPEMITAEALIRAAAAGTVPGSVEAQILLPPGTGEEEFGRIVERTGKFAASGNAAIGGISAQCVTGVKRPVLSVRALPGKQSDAGVASGNKGTLPGPGTALFAAGNAGEAGAAIAAASDEEALRGRFTKGLSDSMLMGLERCLPSKQLLKEAAFIAENGGTVYAAGEGGIFAALYEMALRWDTGFTVDLKRIPIRQETVEICEFYDLNPYQLYSTGMLLAAVPEETMEALEFWRKDGGLSDEGFRFTKIGTLEKAPKKEIAGGEEIRFLEKPQQDMLRVLEDRKKLV